MWDISIRQVSLWLRLLLGALQIEGDEAARPDSAEGAATPCLWRLFT